MNRNVGAKGTSQALSLRALKETQAVQHKEHKVQQQRSYNISMDVLTVPSYQNSPWERQVQDY